MPTPPIIERVKKLDAELSATKPHPATAADLEAIKQQVATVLLEPEHVPHYTSLRDKLRFAKTGFQLHHPKLAAMLDGVTTELNAAGI